MDIDEQISKEFSPRLWVKRMPEYEVLDNHISIITNASKIAKSEVPHVLDIKYGEKSTHLMDIYGTDLDKDSPICVWIHGGYWTIFSKNENNFMAKPLWKAKIKTYVPEYDLVPKVTIEEAVDDIKAMAKYVLKTAAENNVRSVWFGGHSAGAHLASSLLEENWLSELPETSKNCFKGLFLLSGVYDLSPLMRTERNELYKLTSKRSHLLSPHKHFKNFIQKSLLNENFNVIVIAAECDSPAFINQSYALYEELKKVNINAVYRFMTGMDHFEIVEHMAEDDYNLMLELIAAIKGSP